MSDSKPRDARVPIRSRLAEKWRFVVIMIANVWLVFLIMRFGMARQPLQPLGEAEQPAAECSRTTTLIASTALVAAVLGLATGVFLAWPHRSKRRGRLVVYLDEDVPRRSVDDRRG